MGSVPMRMIALFVAALISQMIAVILFPRTNGFTHPSATVACVTVLVFSAWMLARLVHGGVSLGVLFPLMAAIVPLGAVVVGIVLYGEGSSFPKVAMLVIACGLVGLASRMA
jgi:quaternary ammonium compound-resistance protein SugE